MMTRILKENTNKTLIEWVPLLGGGKIVETGHLSPIYVGTCLAISLVKNVSIPLFKRCLVIFFQIYFNPDWFILICGNHIEQDCVVSDLPESEVDELVREFTMIKDFLTVSVRNHEIC